MAGDILTIPDDEGGLAVADQGISLDDFIAGWGDPNDPDFDKPYTLNYTSEDIARWFDGLDKFRREHWQGDQAPQPAWPVYDPNALRTRNPVRFLLQKLTLR